MTRRYGLLATLLVLGLIIVAILGAVSKPKIIVNPGSETDTVSVSGRAELTVDPDKVEIYIEVQTLDDTAAGTKDRNALITEDVIASLKKAGIDKDNIETYSFNLYPRYEWNEDRKKSELVGYELRHTLKVTSDKLDRVGDYIDEAVDAGANRVDKVVFTLSDEKEKEINDEAMGKAALNARDKAEGLAKALSVKLGKIKTISESNYYFAPYQYRGDMLESAVEGKAETNIQPQKLEISATVQVSFEIS